MKYIQELSVLIFQLFGIFENFQIKMYRCLEEDIVSSTELLGKVGEIDSENRQEQEWL